MSSGEELSLLLAGNLDVETGLVARFGSPATPGRSATCSTGSPR
ncbi:hypothetical protein [Actinomadura rubrisoli]|nr:hypothetical protein [Actinomadura rubrisoli]